MMRLFDVFFKWEQRDEKKIYLNMKTIFIIIVRIALLGGNKEGRLASDQKYKNFETARSIC